MDLLTFIFGVLFISGVGMVIGAIADFIKQRRITGQVQLLIFGALLAAANLAGLLGLMAEKWVVASTSALGGLIFTIAGVGPLCSPDLRNHRNWASWAALVIGIGAIVMAFVIVLVPPPW